MITDPTCCNVPMWLESSEDLADMGLDAPGDALWWACAGCGRAEVIAELTDGIPGPLRP